MSKNKKKTAREKRILVGAFLTAVVIAAGSTFAWFTSTDTVTNRLSANADYDVKIVESFAPPANWMPGEKVDKDVYAVNTGNIEAFAKATVSGVMSITREVPVQLSELGNEYIAQSAGAAATDATYKTWEDDQWSDATTLNPAPTAIPAGGVTYGGTQYNVPVIDGLAATSYYDDNDTIIWFVENDGLKMWVEGEHWLNLSGDYLNFYQNSTDVDGAATITVDAQTATPPAGAEGATHYTGSNGNYTWYQLADPGTVAADPQDETWNVGDKVYDCVTLTPDEVAVIEAGAYLAYKPATDEVNKVGNKVIAYNEVNESEAAIAKEYWVHTTGGWYKVDDEAAYNSDVYAGSTIDDRKTKDGAPFNKPATDFTPHGDGLYVFRRSIVVAPGDNKPTSSHAAGTETFEYEGYYFLGGKYYKIMNLNVDADGQFDRAADGITSDGQLDGASACLVREESVYDLKPDSFTYDAANNRIIASYKTNTENSLVGANNSLTSLAEQLDAAEHELAEAELLLERALEDSNIVNDNVKEKTQAFDAAQLAYENALADYEAAKAAFEKALNAYNSGKNAFTPAQQAAAAKFDAVVGATAGENASIALGNADNNPADIDSSRSSVTVDADTSAVTQVDVYGAKPNVTEDAPLVATIKNPAAGSPTSDYGIAKAAYDKWVEEFLASQIGENGDHICFTFLKELANNAGADGLNGNYFTKTKHGEGDDWIDWTNENLKAETVTEAQLVNELDYAVTHVTYGFVRQFVDANANIFATDNHQFHQKFIALKLAEEALETALNDYFTAASNLNKTVDDLGEVEGQFAKINLTGDVKKSDINALDAWKSKRAEELRTAYTNLMGGANADNQNTVTGYNAQTAEEIQALLTSPAGGEEKDLWEAWQALQRAKANLSAVEDQTYIDAGTNLPYKGPNYVKLDGGALPDGYTDATKYKKGTGEYAEYVVDLSGNPVIDTNTVDNEAVKRHLEEAWTNYYNVRNKVDELGRRLKAAQNSHDADGDLNVYIYLQNVTLTGDKSNMWQLLPSNLADDKATFYYTSILAPGEVSKQLIDYVELDERTTKEMYKYFDFDLNVTLDSAQVKFNEDGSRSTEPANIAFDWTESDETTKHDVSGKILDPTKKPVDGANETVVTWSEAAASSTPSGGGNEGGGGTQTNTPMPGNHSIIVGGAPISVNVYSLGTPITIGVTEYGYMFTYENVNYYGTSDNGNFVTSTGDVAYEVIVG